MLVFPVIPFQKNKTKPYLLTHAGKCAGIVNISIDFEMYWSVCLNLSLLASDVLNTQQSYLSEREDTFLGNDSRKLTHEKTDAYTYFTWL